MPVSLDVREFGFEPGPAKDAGAALRNVIEAARRNTGRTRLELPPGDYHVWPETSARRELFVSNTVGTDPRYATKAIGLLLEDALDLEVAAPGRPPHRPRPPADGRVVLLGNPGAGVVAGGRRGIVEVGEMLAGETAGPVLAVRVRRDRQLGLVAWVDGVEIIRYDSNPTLDHGTESASGRLPRHPPTGFSRTALTRYRVGRTTVDARLEDAFVRPIRKRQTPPAIFDDPPHLRRRRMAPLDVTVRPRSLAVTR